MGLQARLASSGNGSALSVQSQRLDSGGSWNSEANYYGCPTYVIYLQLQDDGTNLIQSVSLDGYHWQTIRTEAYNAWCTVDYIGIAAAGTGWQ